MDFRYDNTQPGGCIHKKQTNKQTNKQMLVRNVSFFIAHLSKLLANVKTISMAILNI